MGNREGDLSCPAKDGGGFAYLANPKSSWLSILIVESRIVREALLVTG